MKKLIFVLTIVSLISCGETEYQKKLKSEISKVNVHIEMDSTMSVYWQNKFDSIVMSKERDPHVLRAIKNEQDIVDRELSIERQKKSDLELEFAKTK